MATIRERNGTYQISVYAGFDLNGHRKRETTTFTPPKDLSPKKKEKVVQAFAIEFENRVKNGLFLQEKKLPCVSLLTDGERNTPLRIWSRVPWKSTTPKSTIRFFPCLGI